jgi:hypothetical protein
MNKQEIYVEITNEKERLRAIEILKKSGEKRGELILSVDFQILYFNSLAEQWIIGSYRNNKTKITLDQLEEMLIPKSEMKKQTAVEWLVANIDWQLIKNTSLNYEMIVNKAKEMEREQIIDAYLQGCEKGEMFNNENRAFTTDAEQYYNETFKL